MQVGIAKRGLYAQNSPCNQQVAIFKTGVLLLIPEVSRNTQGSDPIFRNSGLVSLLMWKAIEFASSQRKRFDFAGSWNESIERFVRAFGGRQIPFFEVSKMNSDVVRSYRTFWKLTHRTGGDIRAVHS